MMIKKNDQRHCSRGTEELEDSPLPSLSADSQTDQPELSSLAAMDLTSALTLSDTPDVSPAEPFDLLTEPTDAPVSLIESHDSPLVEASSLPMFTGPAVEDLPHTSPIDLLPSLAVDESMLDSSLTQAIEEATGPAEESAEPADESPHHHHHCSHESSEEEPVE